ncbi:MAG: hypothetical protein GF311_08750 [Candidatus Lokiarchaeota archaeon]|jgi:hypothetical protein|nr:hypothetical protein [Candidatus Lokiarchaeota archaeon]
MSENKEEIPISVFYIGLLIVNLIAGILLLATDFGGFFYDTGTLNIWDFVNIINPIGAPIILIVAICFFYSVFFSLMKLFKKEDTLPENALNIGYYLSIVALILVLLGTIAVVIIGLDATDWWFDTGFYAGIIGGILNFLLYFLMKRQGL